MTEWWPLTGTLRCDQAFIYLRSACYCNIYLLFRAEKIITTSRGHQVPYDYLVLCCGEQFQIAIPSGADVNALVTTAEVPRSRQQVHKGSLPSNVFTINSHQDVQDTLHWIETAFSHTEGSPDLISSDSDIVFLL
jgi:NADPH-dependent 2,4-dienoyl-CoA reductase/sulfur reductase-like enzyme